MASTHLFVLIALCSVIYFSDEVKADCGGLIEDNEGVITSPEYPSDYPSNQRCTWEIKTTPNHRIKLLFKHFDLEEHSSCHYDYVKINIKMEDEQVQEHGRFCGSQKIPIIVSAKNILLIEFKSDARTERSGFEVVFSISKDQCGGFIEGGNGTIKTPFFPIPYPPNKVCDWIIVVPPQHKIKLNFLDFEFEGGHGCKNDFLHIQSNSTDGKIQDYGKYCGFMKTSLITSENSLHLKFVSDRSIQRKGFKLEYFIDKFTDFESSILTRSTAPVYELFDSTVVSRYDDISTESVTSKNKEHTLSDNELFDSAVSQYDSIATETVKARNEEHSFSGEYASTISSFMTSYPSVHRPNLSTTEKQPKEAENLMRNETNIVSALKVLTNKISSIENKQILLFNTLNVLTEKVASFEERQMIFFKNFEKSINEINRLLKLKSSGDDY